MRKKTVFLTMFIFLLNSCGSWDSVKRGLTGAKSKSKDEFLVKKKDPLILPPDFESLPSPSDQDSSQEELSNFEKKLQETSSIINETESSGNTSTEESILKQIKNQ